MDLRDVAQLERIPVQGPPGIPASMLRAYVNRCRASLPAAKAALERYDHGHLRVFGHQLKGTGRAYGIPGLTEMGLLIEGAAGRDDGAELRCQLVALEVYLGRLDILSD